MGYNGAGVYSLPLGSIISDGTDAEAADLNTPLADLEDSLSLVHLSDGRKAAEANWSMGGFKLTDMGNGSAATDSANLSQVQTGVVAHAATVGGTVDAITITFSPANTSWTTKEIIRWTSGGSNTSATPTISKDAGSTTKTIKKGAGAALVAGDTGASGYICEAVYNGTDVILLNPATVATLGTAAAQSASKLVPAGGSVGQYLGKASGTDHDLSWSTPPIAQGFSNLVTKNNTSSPNSQFDVTADSLVLYDGTSSFYLASSVSVTANIASSGANGLDTGAEANSTWYYVWVIYNGSTVSALLSVSATSPTMPSGYTHKFLAGAVYNGSGGNFRTTHGFGRTVFSDSVEVLNGVGVTSWTSLSISSAIPPIAVHAYGWSTSSVNGVLGIRLSSDSSGAIGLCEAVVHAGASTLIDSQYAGTNFSLPILTAQTIWRKHNAASGGQIIIINGFRLNI